MSFSLTCLSLSQKHVNSHSLDKAQQSGSASWLDSCDKLHWTAAGALRSAEPSTLTAVTSYTEQLLVHCVLQNQAHWQLWPAALNSCWCTPFCRTKHTDSCNQPHWTAAGALRSAEPSTLTAVTSRTEQLLVHSVLQNQAHWQLSAAYQPSLASAR